MAHAASAYFAAPFPVASVLVLDGRGERASHLAGRADNGHLKVLATQPLPHSLGLMYEEVTAHLGFRRSSADYKVMALASYGQPRFIDAFRRAVRPTGDGGFVVDPIDWAAFTPPVSVGREWRPEHADLASTAQIRLEEMLLELARWLHDQTGDRALVMAGGVALNCVANSRLAAEGPFDHIWVHPAAGDAGTALGAALYVVHDLGDRVQPMASAALGREWSDAELAGWLTGAAMPYERPPGPWLPGRGRRRSALGLPGRRRLRTSILPRGRGSPAALDLAAARWDLLYVPDVVVHHHPSRWRDARARRRLLTRNALWLAWLRRPLPTAVRTTVRIVTAALGDRPSRQGVMAALVGLRWVWSRRRVVPPAIEAALRRIDEGIGTRSTCDPKP